MQFNCLFQFCGISIFFLKKPFINNLKEDYIIPSMSKPWQKGLSFFIGLWPVKKRLFHGIVISSWISASLLLLFVLKSLSVLRVGYNKVKTLFPTKLIIIFIKIYFFCRASIRTFTFVFNLLMPFLLLSCMSRCWQYSSRSVLQKQINQKWCSPLLYTLWKTVPVTIMESESI